MSGASELRGTSESDQCGRIMVGSGTDTYDPLCVLPEGHGGQCKSPDAIDQHRLGEAIPPNQKQRGS